MKRLTLGAMALAVGVMLATPVAAQISQAKVAQGALKGKVEGQVGTFLGVPFAAPPVGDLRWQPPRPAARWSGTRGAIVFPSSCQQAVSPAGFGPWTHEYVVAGPVSEDCLYLNIWTPAKKAGEKLAVMVWIHGGAFNSGSASIPIYDGTALAKKGIIVVDINYRLGVYGFLAHPGLTAESPARASGNYGLLDQIAALKWVQQNIAAFGGDPSRVTIAGQSAGAASVHHLIASPLAKGLFSRAIAQSGSGMGLNVPGLQQAEKSGLTLMQAAGAKDLAELRRLPVAAIDAAVAKIPPGSGPSFAPIVDGLALPSGTVGVNTNDTPILTGMTAEEMLGLNPLFGKVTPAVFANQLDRYGVLAGDVAKLYPAANDAQANEAFEAITRDRGLASMASWAGTRLKGSGQPIYAYLWTHAEPGPEAERYQAFHSSEIPYVFGALGASPERGFGTQDQALVSLMTSYWANWVNKGDPNGAGLPVWPRYQVADRQILEIGHKVTARAILPEDKRSLFNRYVANGGALSLF